MVLFRKEFLFYLSCIILNSSTYLYAFNQKTDNDKTKTNNFELKTSFDSYNELDNYLQNIVFKKYNYDTIGRYFNQYIKGNYIYYKKGK